MKEYLLLRNNKQSGPYSAEDLRSMGLMALDLVWVEKKSSCWRYPSEIRELAPFAPPAEEPGTMSPAQDRKVINIAEKTISPSRTDTIPVKTGEVKHSNHIVTLKPHVDQIRVKTIKSIGQPRIVNVQMRNDDSMEKSQAWMSSSPVSIAAVSDNINTYLPAEDRCQDFKSTAALPAPGGANKFFSIKTFQGDPDNKLELMVLMIGAISLLAIAYLLITSPY
jgi:hypothetical protein